MARWILMLTLPLLAGCSLPSTPPAAPATPPSLAESWQNPGPPYVWTKLDTEPYRGKQDDIFFLDAQTGWYVNGSGKIYKTEDGGATWQLKLDQPGTYFRCIGFIDEKRGFAGNIGTEYFPNVSDEVPLYETRDGGETWQPVTKFNGPTPKGLCAIDIVHTPFINAGVLDHRTTVWATGRVGGPTYLIHSTDEGDTWTSVDMSGQAGMLLDVEFVDGKNGFLSAATSANVAESHALILRTTDGGESWTPVYQSKRPWETTWKSSFPSDRVGYVTIQSYDRDPAVVNRYVAKTVDGGLTWQELPLTDDPAVREFGVGFIDERTGWVGTTTTGFETLDGGATWSRVELGKAVNNFSLVRTPEGFAGYAIGLDVYKLEAQR